MPPTFEDRREVKTQRNLPLQRVEENASEHVAVAADTSDLEAQVEENASEGGSG